MQELLIKLSQLSDISRILTDDIDLIFMKVCNTGIKRDKQFWRRTYVRSLFARIEGITYNLKHLAPTFAELNNMKLSRAETAILKEESYKVNNDGDAITDKSKIRTADNLLFTFKIVHSVCKSANKINKSSKDWYYFNEPSHPG
jgi:hypothetical protein